jgi:hypothetical protein
MHHWQANGNGTQIDLLQLKAISYPLYLLLLFLRIQYIITVLDIDIPTPETIDLNLQTSYM